MATATQVSASLLTMEEYLCTSYHPDCGYVEGRLEERHPGEYKHSNLQAALIAWFFPRGAEWNIRALPEQRLRVSETRVRVPDVCLVPRDQPQEKVRVTPPLLCIEVLSAEDRESRVVEVLEDYRAMGVKHVWLFGPLERAVFTYSESGLRPVKTARMEIAGTPIYVDLGSLSASLD